MGRVEVIHGNGILRDCYSKVSEWMLFVLVDLLNVYAKEDYTKEDCLKFRIYDENSNRWTVKTVCGVAGEEIILELEKMLAYEKQKEEEDLLEIRSKDNKPIKVCFGNGAEWICFADGRVEKPLGSF